MKPADSWLLDGEPHKIQAVALSWLSGRRAAGVLLDQGLGKTAVMLAENAQLLNANRIIGHVVVCPNSLKESWEEQAQKFGFSPDVPFYAWPDVPADLLSPYLFAINYEALLGRGYKAVETALRSSPCMLTLDESIRIKQPPTGNRGKTTRNVIQLGKYAEFKRILSGKPMTQGPQDLWAQLRFLEVPETRGSFYSWRNRFCQMGGFQGKQVTGFRQERLEELQSIIERHCIRATKADWTDLPDKLYSTRRYDLSKDTAKLYSQLWEEFAVEVRAGTTVEAPMVVTQLGKLAQISSGFIYDEEGRVVTLPGKNAKLEALRECLDDLDGKALIMAYFKPSCELLRRELADLEPAMLLGKTEMARLGLDQRAEKRRFDRDPKCRVMVVQIESGKYGHTLLGDQGDETTACHHTFYFENVYSLDARAQSEDRNHRWGQTRTVLYTDFVGTPIEAKVIAALQRKENIVQAVVEAVAYRD